MINMQIQNDMEEFEQYGRGRSLTIDEVPTCHGKRKEPVCF